MQSQVRLRRADLVAKLRCKRVNCGFDAHVVAVHVARATTASIARAMPPLIARWVR